MSFQRIRIFFAALLIVLPLAAVMEAPLQGWAAQRAWQYVQFGRYPQDAGGAVQPIRWRVLDVQDGVAYLLSDQILDVKRIDGDQWNYKGWFHSELHAWLQTEFLDEAFTPEEKKALHEDPELGYVSLPSSDDVQNKAYGFLSAKDRYFYGTPHAFAQGLYRYGRNDSYSPIFTRTPSNRAHAHRSTKIRGGIGFIGVESDDLGMMPVIWLKMDWVNSLAGAGTLTKPLQLVPVEVPS